MGGGSDGEGQDNDAAAGTGEEQLRGTEAPGVPLQLVVCEALEVLTVRRCGAEEKVPGDEVVNLAGIRGAEGAVERERQELSLLVADKGHRFLEGIDRLDGATDGALHGVEGTVNGCFLRWLTGRY